MALALLLGCGIDDRNPTAMGIGSLSPEAGPPGSVGPEIAPALGVEPLAFDFGGAVVGSPSRARVSVVNLGNAPLDAPIAALLPGSDPEYAILHNQCDNSVPSAGRCDIRIQLVPSEAGESAAMLGVQSSGQSADVALAGVGLASGPLTLAPSAGSASDFGGVTRGESLEAAFDVSNPAAESSGPLAISVNEAQFRLLAPGEGDCQPGTTALVDGQRCRVRVAFAPVRRGSTDATLLVSSAIGSTALPLAGTGLLPASLRAPALVELGGVVLQSVALRTFIVENAGDSPLELAGVGLQGAASASMPVASGMEPGLASAFSVQNSDCGAGKVLAGGERCSVTVAFRPLVAEANQQTTLVVSAEGGVSHDVALTGNGLSQGALALAPAPGDSADFGALAVGQSLRQQFVITNPSAQPSGALEIQAVDDFVVMAGSAEGECQSGVTSLVNGESCSVAVAFTPSARGQRDGGLLVSSVLAGAAHLPLAGSGLALPKIEVVRAELDFGRVPTDTPVLQTLTVLNRGDQPLSGVQAVLEAPSGGLASGFSLLGACNGALSAGAPCELGLQFLPTEAGMYAAVLRLTSDTGGSSSTLLLGRSFPRGSLVLAATEGTTDFGDVAIGSSPVLGFTLTNPGSVASGRLTLSSSSNLFTIAEGDCNPEGSAGLLNGSSCTFTVTFTPITSEALTVNLSVQSPGAGETALTLTGRGRTPPSLTATGNRDFGSAVVDDDALGNPLNQFTWTLTNEGDLQSGPLRIENSNPAEFIVSNDTCANVSVPGHGACTMDIRFRPGVTGVRTANLDAIDSVSLQPLRLAMTGNGILIAGPGELCVNADCSSGVCTGGVCCDRACIGSCQACSASGVCTDQAERQPCGNGNGQCFGVDRCLLPELLACSGDDQCNSGNCEQRLGQGPNNRICCLDNCGAGQQCNPQTGRCQVPALGAGAACGVAGQPACGGGLECKACLGGGRVCTPPGECCGGCGLYDCIDGECGCPIGSNGQPQIDCGNGQCILNRQNACCAASPSCPASAPVCDGPAGLCRQCLQAADCPPGATGTFRSCTNFTCVYACSTQQGFRDCNGTCIASNQCCGCSASEECSNGQCLISNGNTCSLGGTGCASGNCSAGRCCAPGCANGCNTQGSCSCPNGQEFARGACRLSNGQTCTNNDQCATNGCTSWFADCDADGFSSSSVPVVQRCGPTAPTGSPQSCTSPGGRFVQRDQQGRLDCCDTSDLYNPGRTGFLESPFNTSGCANIFDSNCDGIIESEFPATTFASCEGPTNLPCTQRSGVLAGDASFLGIQPADLTNQSALPNICGNSSAQYNVCTSSGNACVAVPRLAPRCR